MKTRVKVWCIFFLRLALGVVPDKSPGTTAKMRFDLVLKPNACDVTC